MDRQKPRTNQYIDGLRQGSKRSQFYIDGIIRSNQPRQSGTGKDPLPVMRQRQFPRSPAETADKLPTTVRPGIYQPQISPSGSLSEKDRRAPGSPVRSSSFDQPINQAQPAPSSTDRVDTQQSMNLSLGSLPATKIKTRSKWRSPKRIVKTTAIVFAILVLGFGGWIGSTVLGNLNRVFHGNVFTDAQALIGGSKLKESNGRINILLAGDSVGDPHHQGAALADSIMVLSFDPQTKSGFILSIPRDLWVYVPSFGDYQKINAANDGVNFNQAGYPSGGMGQLEKIVTSDLGMPIDYYSLIDYAAFRDAVNAVGGINVNIQSPDPRGIYDAFTHLKLPNGEDYLNGQQALDLARARGDDVAGDISYGIPNSDFTRTMYQRKMLIALFKKSLSVGVMTNPVKIANLFNAFGNNIQTDLTLGNVVSLIHDTSGVRLSNIQSESFSYGGSNALLTNYTDPKSGQEALIPSAGIGNYSQLQQYFKQLTSSNPIVQESPTVVILNGSSVNGLAAKERQVMQNKGLDVVSIGDASTQYPSSMIVDNSNGHKPAAQKAVEQLVSGQVVSNTNGSSEAGEATNYTADFVIILGNNWAQTQSGNSRSSTLRN